MKIELNLYELIVGMQPRWWHVVMRLAGVEHRLLREWCPVFCPCDIDLDPGDEDLDESWTTPLAA